MSIIYFVFQMYLLSLNLWHFLSFLFKFYIKMLFLHYFHIILMMVMIFGIFISIINSKQALLPFGIRRWKLERVAVKGKKPRPGLGLAAA